MDSDRDGAVADFAADEVGGSQAGDDAVDVAEDVAEEEVRQQHEIDDDETLIPLLMLDPAALQSKTENGGIGVGRGYFSEAPPPSPEKSRHRRRRRTRPDPGDAPRFSEDLRRQSGLELEIEELLDNSTQWRKSHQARIRTPVRRAVLAYGGASPGRRQQVLCDLNAKVRELEVAALSRGIAYSLRTTAAAAGQQKQQQQQPGDHSEEPGDPRLDPRVRMAYQQAYPKQSGRLEPADQQPVSSWHYTGRLQQRVRSRATAGLSREGTSVSATTVTDAAGCRPRRAKTSLTTATTASAASDANRLWPTSLTKADLLRLQTINGEVQRSLYNERNPTLRRLLHAGGDDPVGVLGGISGIGSSRLHVSAGLLARPRAIGGSVCPPATATGAGAVRRLAAAAAAAK